MDESGRLVISDKLQTYLDNLKQMMADDGPFATIVQNYKSRDMQIEMASAITQAIVENDTLIAEAGTGTGKTFAYLVPALQWGGKVIVSTGTKNLQDQLFLRDIPTVRKALRMPVTVALLKGRANYVCRYHLERTQESSILESKKEAEHLRKIVKFAQMTSTGDKSEISGVPESASIWRHVTSTRENCPGSDCPYFGDCFLMQARREAMQADVVVVNHHLFFADLVLKDGGFGDLLPTANTIIFDEAHQLPETATRFFGEFISTSQILDWCRDVLKEGLSHAKALEDWQAYVAKIDKAARGLRLDLPEYAVRLAIEKVEKREAFTASLDKLTAEIQTLDDALQKHIEHAETLEMCHENACQILAFLHKWLSIIRGETKTDQVVWVETMSSAVQLHLTPLSVADIFSKQREGPDRAWIFTSATLSVKQNFSYFADRLGLGEATAKQWPSPFNYPENALLYVPSNEIMPDPNTQGYSEAVIQAALPLIEAVDGGTFILCTSLRAVDYYAERLQMIMHKKDENRPIYVQGRAGKTELLERFRRNGKGILIGSQSFWEGIDVRGRALSLVIVDRLPFAAPDDPVLAARLEALKRNGGNGFLSYQVPEATISLRQGAGRLIRDEDDCGVLMICDTRLVEKPYGRRIWQSLPPFKRTRDEAVACEFLKQHAHKVEKA